MASAFTHAYVALPLVALAGPALERKRCAALLVTVSMLPDLDVLGFAAGIPYAHPLGHRGLSHSLAFAIALGGLAVLVQRHFAAPARRVQWRLFLAVTLACASHGVLDAFTDAGQGVGFWLPFSSERFFFPWRPIATSPLNPASFFSAHGAPILAVEIRWVWFPVTLGWFGVTLTRRVAQRRIES